MIWIYGAGGFGRETADAARAAGIDVLGFLDDAPPHHPPDDRTVRVPDGIVDDPAATVVLAVADPATRSRLDARVRAGGATLGAVVHPAAAFGSGVRLGPGAVVLAQAYVSTDARFGRGGHVNYGATIGHDVVAGDHVTVLPGANVAGAVHLGDRVLVGSGAVILQGLRIGADAVIGAGAVVTADVAPSTTVVGVPARPR